MASNGFTKIINSILDDKNISFDAKGVYMILVRYYSIPEFKINKTHIKSVTGLGEIRFSKAWKELKENNILIQDKKRVNGRFEYVYTLKSNEATAKVVAPVDKKKSKLKHVDSNSDAPLDGQVHIDDVLEVEQQQEVPVKEDIEAVAEVTGIKPVEAAELLKVANNDVSKVIECYKYTAAQDNVRDSFSYTKWAIKNNKVLKYTVANVKPKGSFNDYSQRTYDFYKLERALLYGEAYELPA